jgi:hypothetical protein
MLGTTGSASITIESNGIDASKSVPMRSGWWGYLNCPIFSGEQKLLTDVDDSEDLSRLRKRVRENLHTLEQ